MKRAAEQVTINLEPMQESELEAVRSRSAEMAESLDEQKRISAQQQAQWTEELKRMRCLLENVSGQLSQITSLKIRLGTMSISSELGAPLFPTPMAIPL